MHNTKSHIIFASTFLLLIATPACFADLMCYVCKDCSKVDSDTPLLACNEGFFNQGGSTEASTTTTVATTILPADDTTTSTESANTDTSTSNATPETTTTTVEDTTVQGSNPTDIPASPGSTEPAMPTPATVGPPEATTGVPTPPNQDTIIELSEKTPIVNPLPGKTGDSTIDNTQPGKAADVSIANPQPGNATDVSIANPQPGNATDSNIRQRRSVINTDVSYHCYSVKKTFNNTVQTERGCSRVAASQSVCDDLKLQNNATQLSNCDPCSMNACNSATSVVQSTLLGTFLVALVAALLQRY